MLILPLLAAGSILHPVNAATDPDTTPAFDITRAEGTTDGRLVTFAMEVTGQAGAETPAATGAVHGASVESYVWPTDLDPQRAGFAAGSGILALTITAHPDFDDTPLFDENADGDPGNDGAGWHSHWIVLGKDDACAAGLKVKDVSPGTDVLPLTAPMLPIALDSPGMSPRLDGRVAAITVPMKGAEGASFDGVTARLTVNTSGDGPFLCVTGVHDIASGDLSLPGKVMAK